MLFISLIILLITKYVLIYLNHLVEDLDEEWLLHKIKASLILVPVFSCFVEYTYLSRFDSLAKFQQRFLGYTKEDSKTEVIRAVLILADFLAMTVTYIRIEYDAIQAQDEDTGCANKIMKLFRLLKENGLNNIVSNHFGYSTNFVRTMWICGLSMAILVVYNFTVGKNNARWNMIIFTIIMTVCVPILFILKHPGMKKVGIKMIQSFIPDSFITVNI